jgi:uncharacterized membrane protein
MIWAMYFTVGAVNLIIPINHWVEAQQSLNGYSNLAKNVLALAPLVYVLTILYVLVRIILNIGKNPLIKYSDKEKQYQGHSRINELKAKYPALKRFLKR